MEHGLYVHVPFCARKCHYCDFNTYAVDQEAVSAYMRAVAREAAMLGSQTRARFETVFIGGGTPTVLSPEQLTTLIDDLRGSFDVAADAEITVEANPSSLSPPKLAAMLEAGVNRLSVGVQSFDDALLQRIGRLHSASQGRRAVLEARRAGFANINLDLMFGLPGQDLATWEQTLDEAVALEPEHLSCYQLIVEDGTLFGRLHAEGQLHLPGEEEELRMFERTRAKLRAAGFEMYEISNYAKPGRRCRHNMIYWRNERWLGLGPGAWSQWDDGGRTIRWMNERSPERYAGRLAAGELPVAEREEVGVDEAMDETMMLGLRMMDGVEDARFSARFGRSVEEVYGPVVSRLTDRGLIAWDGARVRLTDEGAPLANQAFAAFLR